MRNRGRIRKIRTRGKGEAGMEEDREMKVGDDKAEGLHEKWRGWKSEGQRKYRRERADNKG